MEQHQLNLPEGWDLILCALVGSHAYGLNTPDSDEDYLGIYRLPTPYILGLGPEKGTVTNTGRHQEGVEDGLPDWTYHEIGKFMRLALKCNPTLLELLYLPEENYVAISDEARALINYRHLFLSTKGVRNAFGGYAMSQARRLERRNAEGKEGFSSDTKKRTAKHARHCFRLLNQGAELLARGDMEVRVENPDDLFRLGEMSTPEIVDAFEKEYALFNLIPSVLPDEPDQDALDWLLQAFRLRPLELDVADLQERLDNATDLLKTFYFASGPDTSGALLPKTGET